MPPYVKNGMRKEKEQVFINNLLYILINFHDFVKILINSDGTLNCVTTYFMPFLRRKGLILELLNHIFETYGLFVNDLYLFCHFTQMLCFREF